MEETSINPAVQKLLDFAKDKPFVTWDEATDILGQDFVNSPQMENVLKYLNEKNIQLVEPDLISDEESTTTSKTRFPDFDNNSLSSESLSANREL